MDRYEHIRSFIQRGAVFDDIILAEHDFVLRLKNPSSQALEWMFDYSPTSPQKRECALVSACAHSINGTPVPSDLATLAALAKHLHKNTPSHTTSRIFLRVLGLMRKAREAHEYLEAYCYEDESRLAWRKWKANGAFGYLPLPEQTCLNEAQMSWVTWNQVEDDRLTTKGAWERSLLVASAFNGKAAKDISSKWQSDDSLEKKYREDIKKLAREGKLSTVDTSTLRAKTDSFDDLREEMRRWLSGEEDDHDRIVREHKEYMYNKIEEDRLRAEEASLRNKQRLEELDLLNAGAPLRAYTNEEIQNLNIAPTRTKTSSEFDERFDHVKERYIYARETSGVLHIDEQGDISAEAPPKKSLMEQINSRPPTLK